MLKDKQKALKLVEEKHCTVENLLCFHLYDPKLEIFPPEGYVFDGVLTSLICFDWFDVFNRLFQISIDKEISNE